MLNLNLNFVWIYITKKLANATPSFIAQKSSITCFVERNCLALILTEKISDDMNSSSLKRFAQNEAGLIPISMSIDSFIVTFSKLM